MRALERRVAKLETLLDVREVLLQRHGVEAAAGCRRGGAASQGGGRGRHAAHAAWQAQRAVEAAKRQAEDAARAVLPPVELRVVAPPPLPPEPKPPPWSYDPPPEMQIRPVSWRRSEPYDDGSEDNYGQCIVDYDPLAQEDADYYDDS